MLLIMMFLDSCFIYLGIRECLICLPRSTYQTFQCLGGKLVYSMYKRVLASSNSLVRTLLDSNFFVTSRIYKQWMQILF